MPLLCLATAALSQETTPTTDPIRFVHHVDGRLVSSTHPIYDEEGTLTASIGYTYDEQGVVETRQMTGYNAHGQIERRIIYSADEILLLEETYKYDRKGHMTRHEQTTYEVGRPIKTVETRKYTYNRDGSIKECRYYHNGVLVCTLPQDQ